MKLTNTEKKTATAKTKVEKKTLGYKLEKTPRGKALFTYWLAILKNQGGFTPSRKVMNQKTLRSYFATGTVISHHLSNGNLEKTKTGVRLTTTGWNYFNGRLTGSTVGQEVDKPEMEELAKALKTGKLEKSTVRFPRTTKLIPIKE